MSDDEDNPYKDKRPRVEDPKADSRSWFHTVGMGNFYLRKEQFPPATLSFMRSNGFFLHDSSEKVDGVQYHLTHLCQDKSPLLLEAGPLNLVFLNDYISWSGGDLRNDKVLMEGGAVVGTSFRDSNRALRDRLDSLGITGREADAEIIRMFRSDEVVRNENPCSLRINWSRQPDPERQFFLNGELILPREAGYWRVTFPRIKDVPLPLEPEWKEALAREAFSYRFYPSTGNLFFSNTVGAKHGLPPTAKHLGLPKLDLGSRAQPNQEIVPNPCTDCAKHRDEIASLQNLVASLLAKKKTNGSFSFPSGVTRFTSEGDEFAFQYKGKVVVKK